MCVALWEAGGRGGLKCVADKWILETKEKPRWTTRNLFCGKVGGDSVESISYKRMIALIYEMSCSEHPADTTAELLSRDMKNDNGLTKMILSLVQASLAVRCVATLPVRSMEKRAVKEHL